MKPSDSHGTAVLRLSALSPLAFMVPLCTATALAAVPGALHVADATHLFPAATWHASDDALRGAAMVLLACTLCFAAARVRAPFWVIGLALVPLVAWLVRTAVERRRVRSCCRHSRRRSFRRQLRGMSWGKRRGKPGIRSAGTEQPDLALRR